MQDPLPRPPGGDFFCPRNRVLALFYSELQNIFSKISAITKNFVYLQPKGGDENVRDYRWHIYHLADYKNWRTQRLDGNQSLGLIVHI